MPYRPGIDEVLLDMAQLMSKRGTCSRTQVGVVIAHDGRVLSSGYNGTPSGLPHCKHSICEGCAPSPTPVMDYLHDRIAHRGHLPTCESITGCQRAVHAESNAIAWAARHGASLLGSTMYSTHTPCIDCAKLIIQAGIMRVVAAKRYRLTAGASLLAEAGIVLVVNE